MESDLQRCYEKVISDPSYSLRRYYVDTFFIKYISIFGHSSSILDMGGLKGAKRGEFNIEKYDLHVKYANISEKSSPDYLCDITQVPVDDNTFDGAILAEVLEHVVNPEEILQEAHRIIKSGGKILITTPFMFHLHADPHDYCRYTDYWYREILQKTGFRNIQVYKQGLFPSVAANMAKNWFYELRLDNNISKIKKKWYGYLVQYLVKKAFLLENKKFYQENWKLAGHTTGFGVVCEK